MILIGLTVEISLFFAINGDRSSSSSCPPIRGVRILGLPNRWALAIGLSLVSVGVELLLHADGVFHWYYWWWNVASFPVIVVFGYLTFYVVAFMRLRHARAARASCASSARWPRWCSRRGSCSARCSAGSGRRDRLDR